MIQQKVQRNNFIDLLVVSILILLAVPTILYLNVRFLTSTVFFFVIPSIYLLFRKVKSIKRIVAASFLFGIIFAFILDFLAEFNSAWSWPAKEKLFFPNFIFGVIPIDVMIWYCSWVFFIVIFYEHFIEQDVDDKVSHNFVYALLPSIFALGAILLLYFTIPEFLRFNYAYFWLGLFTLLPFAYLAWEKPQLINKFLKIAPFFIFLFLVFELTAIKLGQWSFPGQYIGSVILFNLSFPFEEFFFWILMSSTIVLAYYELWVDDMK